VGRGARQRRGCVACGSVSGVNLERSSCSEVPGGLSAASSRWPPRRRTIIPRRPESLSIRLNAPIAFLASRNAAATSSGLGDCGGCTLLGRAAGRRRSGCWGFERKPVVSRGRSESRLRDVELAVGSLSSRWSWCWMASCRLSRKPIAVDERTCNASPRRHHEPRAWPHRRQRAARGAACWSDSALRRPEVLAEVLARGFERKTSRLSGCVSG
jgi:hypothetical protein